MGLHSLISGTSTRPSCRFRHSPRWCSGLYGADDVVDVAAAAGCLVSCVCTCSTCCIPRRVHQLLLDVDVDVFLGAAIFICIPFTIIILVALSSSAAPCCITRIHVLVLERCCRGRAAAPQGEGARGAGRPLESPRQDASQARHPHSHEAILIGNRGSSMIEEDSPRAENIDGMFDDEAVPLRCYLRRLTIVA